MRTIVSEVPETQRRISEYSNEILDDSLNRVQRIDVNLALNGEVAQLLPNLAKDTSQVCQLRPDDLKPVKGFRGYTQAELDRMELCVQALAREGNTGEQLLSNPVISLSSSPPRTEGQIVRLLGEQIFAIADSLQGSTTGELIQSGLIQIALPMIFQSLIYDIETSISNTIGSTDFRVVPFLETIYQVEEDGFIRVSYDYTFNEVKVRYEKRF